jgi:hypothetical protein
VLSTEAASFRKRRTSCEYRKRITRRKSKEPPHESSSRSSCINNDCKAPGQGPQRRYPRKLSKRQRPPLNTFYHRHEPTLPPPISGRIPIGRRHHQSYLTSPCSTGQDLPTSQGSRPNQLRPIHCCNHFPYSTSQWKTRGLIQEPRLGEISPGRQNKNPHPDQTRQLTIHLAQEVRPLDHRHLLRTGISTSSYCT